MKNRPAVSSMKILISPAKKMQADTDSLDCRDLPVFLPQAQRLLDALRALSPGQRRALWKCSQPLASQNDRLLPQADLRQNLTPALLAYDGIQYQYMAPGVFTYEEFDYVQEHLRILSGFYGLLRPFDGVIPYRLEMQAKLAAGGAADLYAFWGDSIARCLAAETDVLINLASKEYSRSVLPHLPAGVRVISCTFGEEKDGRILEKATLCKMARGEMVRYMAQNRCQKPEEIQRFDRLGFLFVPERSDEKNYVFKKEGKKDAASRK